MLWGCGLLFGRLKVDVNRVTNRKIGQDLILLGIIVVLCPALLKNDSTLKAELLKIANLNFDLGLLRHAFLGTENRNETTEYGGIYLVFLVRKLPLRRDLIGGSKSRVRLDLGVVKNQLRVLEFNRIPEL